MVLERKSHARAVTCWGLVLGLGLALGSPGCGGAAPRPAEEEGVVDGAAPSPEAAQLLAQESALLPAGAGGLPDSLTFRERVVVIVEGTAEDIEAMRDGVPAEDFEVAADDAMYYRASAYEYLERQHLPVKTFQGRPPLAFVVDGVVRRLDLSQASTLDVVILYEQNREPCIIAPVDVYLAESYFNRRRPGVEGAGCK